MIVTIDGPAGAGKSTVTRLLASKLDFCYLDTGAMYRSVTFQAMRLGIDLADEPALQTVAATLPLRFEGENVFIDDFDATTAIRTPEVTRNVAAIADAVSVRSKLVELQRRIASRGDFVCEGRDQGTVAFPDALCKIFLTASANARATRRADQLQAAGHFVDFDQIVKEQETRDQQDQSRPIGRLQKADDAIEINTDHHSIDEVVQILVRLVKDCIAN